jgi:uncharacterized protein YqeY
MSLKDRILEDLKAALKSKQKEKLSTLRLLSAAIRNKEIELRRTEEGLGDDEVIGVVSAEIKKRREAIEHYEKAGRRELAERERAEIEVLAQYMPEPMSEEEIRQRVLGIIGEIGAAGVKDTGKVMKLIMPVVKGRADGALVSRIVQEELEKI